MNSAANFVLETGLPHVVVVLRWVLLIYFVPEIYVSPLSDFEKHIYSSDPGSETNPKPQPGHFNNSTTQQPRSEKPLQSSGSHTFLSFSCFSIADQEAVSLSAALLLRIKAVALHKRPLFVLFALVGRTAAILDVTMLSKKLSYNCRFPRMRLYSKTSNYGEIKQLFKTFSSPHTSNH